VKLFLCLFSGVGLAISCLAAYKYIKEMILAYLVALTFNSCDWAFTAAASIGTGSPY
jgi:hypothetical protein